jgi:iron complex outermembrane receptor protein
VTSTVFPAAGPVSNSVNQSFNNFSYNITLDYKFTDDVSIYLRNGTGYRAGGINARAFRGAPYKPEKATVYEAGLKSELLDRRVRFNAAIYQTDYKNFQTGGPQVVDPDAGFVSDTINAGKARYRGFEGELTVAPTEGLTLMADVAYVDPKFRTFMFGGVDVSDVARFPYNSKWQYHAGARYEFPPMSIGKLAFNIDYSYKGSRSFTVFAPTTVPAGTPDPTIGEKQHELSARLSLADIQLGGAKAEFAVFGQNLTNDHYRNVVVDFGALGYISATFNRPRVVGAELRFAF